MMCSKNLLLIFMLSMVIPTAWASQNTSGLFSIAAGEKKLSFQKNPNLEWRQFCYDTPLGCARFKHDNGKAAPIFGYVKVVTNKLPEKDFNSYCKEVFKISASIDKTLNSFNMNTKTNMPHCSWMGQKDMTHFFWKNGLTIVVNTNDQFDVVKILGEAKLNEKR